MNQENLEAILNVNPKHTKALLELGELYRQQQNPQKAKECFEKILEFDPNNFWANVHLSLILIDTGFLDEAKTRLEKTLEEHPDRPIVLIKLGELEKKCDRLETALSYFEKVEKLSPDNWQIGIKIAEILQTLGRLSEAETQFKKTLVLAPNNFSIFIKLGYLERTKGQRKQALSWFYSAEKVANDISQTKEAGLLIIEELRELNRLDEALSKLEPIFKQEPNRIRTLMIFGSILSKQNNFDGAVKVFKNILKLDPQNTTAKINLARNLSGAGQIEEAIKLLESEPELQKDNRVQLQLSNLYRNQKNPDLANIIEIYRKIVFNETNNLSARLELAKNLTLCGRLAEANKVLEETHQLLGEDVRVLLQLGKLAQISENWDKANQWYQKAYEKYPENPQVYCQLANCLFLQGEIEVSIDLLERGQKLLPNAVEITANLAQMHYSLGNLECSYELLEKARKDFPDYIPLSIQLSRLYLILGDFIAAKNVLDNIHSDRQNYKEQIESIRAEIATHEYNYSEGEKHLKQAIAYSLTPERHRLRLASILIMRGKLEASREQLKLATTDITDKNTSLKAIVPLRSHPAMVINALRINPLLMQQLEAAQQKTGYEKLVALANIAIEEPSYLGAGIYLSQELRKQGIFEGIHNALPVDRNNFPDIPKRIIQFWNEPEPPLEIKKLSQTWIELNPDYEYILFSWNSAIDFIDKHYNRQILQAFKNCQEPATQADFFRLAYLNKMGGFYVDADDRARKPLNAIVRLKPELVAFQEDYGCIANNFLGCIPEQPIIRTAFYQVVANLLDYSADGPWLKSGPALLTCKLCQSLLPYISYTDYRMWPRLLVLSQAELRTIVTPHIRLPYKNSDRHWQNQAYRRNLTKEIRQNHQQ